MKFVGKSFCLFSKNENVLFCHNSLIHSAQFPKVKGCFLAGFHYFWLRWVWMIRHVYWYNGCTWIILCRIRKVWIFKSFWLLILIRCCNGNGISLSNNFHNSMSMIKTTFGQSSPYTLQYCVYCIVCPPVFKDN